MSCSAAAAAATGRPSPASCRSAKGVLFLSAIVVVSNRVVFVFVFVIESWVSLYKGGIVVFVVVVAGAICEEVVICNTCRESWRLGLESRVDSLLVDSVASCAIRREEAIERVMEDEAELLLWVEVTDDAVPPGAGAAVVLLPPPAGITKPFGEDRDPLLDRGRVLLEVAALLKELRNPNEGRLASDFAPPELPYRA